MSRFESDNNARRLGEALARLRRHLGLSQAEAGRRAGMTSQGWGLYESGKRPGLFRPDVQQRLTAALDASVEDLIIGLEPAELAALPAKGMESRSRPFSGPLAGLRRLQLSNDDLAPWAMSGTILEYEPGRWPRRDQGCVIEMADGELRVRLYERADGDVMVVRAAAGAAEERIDRSTTRSVSAVVARLER